MKIKQINLCFFCPSLIFSLIGGIKPYPEIGDGSTLPQKPQFSKNDIDNDEANILINSFQDKKPFINMPSLGSNNYKYLFYIKENTYKTFSDFNTNIFIHHNAEISDTFVTIESFVSSSFSYAVDIGVYAEASFFLDFSFKNNIGISFLTTNRLTIGKVLKLGCVEGDLNYAPSGKYEFVIQLKVANFYVFRVNSYDNSVIKAWNFNNFPCFPNILLEKR